MSFSLKILLLSNSYNDLNSKKHFLLSPRPAPAYTVPKTWKLPPHSKLALSGLAVGFLFSPPVDVYLLQSNCEFQTPWKLPSRFAHIISQKMVLLRPAYIHPLSKSPLPSDFILVRVFPSSGRSPSLNLFHISLNGWNNPSCTKEHLPFFQL